MHSFIEKAHEGSFTFEPIRFINKKDKRNITMNKINLKYTSSIVGSLLAVSTASADFQGISIDEVENNGMALSRHYIFGELPLSISSVPACPFAGYKNIAAAAKILCHLPYVV